MLAVGHPAAYLAGMPTDPDPRPTRLAQDLAVLAQHTDRRHVLKVLAAAGLAPVLGCGGSGARGGSAGADAAAPAPRSGPAPSDSADPAEAGSRAGPDPGRAGPDGPSGPDTPPPEPPPASCSQVPAETAGPFPGDGSNGPNALALTGIVRSDIRASLPPHSGLAQGVPLTLQLRLVDVQNGCAPLPGHAVYVWHCDRDGQYSMYMIKDQNYLRGVQAADAAGLVTFRTVFPATYPGRWPHVHFEVYGSLADATKAGAGLRTSQLALPKAACDAVYATPGYEASIAAFAELTLESDGVFADGATLQMATVTGTVATGLVAKLVVGL